MKTLQELAPTASAAAFSLSLSSFGSGRCVRPSASRGQAQREEGGRDGARRSDEVHGYVAQVSAPSLVADAAICLLNGWSFLRSSMPLASLAFALSRRDSSSFVA